MLTTLGKLSQTIPTVARDVKQQEPLFYDDENRFGSSKTEDA